MTEHVFNPFDPSLKMCWNLWWPGETNVHHLKMEDCVCLMLDRSTGRMYMKNAIAVTVEEWNQMAGGDVVVAVASEKECH